MHASLSVSPLDEAVDSKEQLLRALVSSYSRVVVAYSGGVDSAYLAHIAHEELGDRALAVTAQSASLMQVELQDAATLAQQIGIQHEVVQTQELDRPAYQKNDTGRCYQCKDELFDATAAVARAQRGTVVLDGFNADDLKDFRPGHRAAAEHDVRHPLAEADLSKADIRALSKRCGLPTWQKPQLACLSSRLPYGMTVTPERLGKVEAVEMALRAEGFFDLRARLVKDNDDMVRIEVGAEELPRIVQAGVRERIRDAAVAAGFRFVTVDLDGFRSGRLNDGLVQLGKAGI